MKSIYKLFLLLPLALGISLSSCKNSGNNSVTPEPDIVEPDVATVEGIVISGEFKTEYYTSEEFDSTGIVVTATLSDETTKDVTSETEFSGFDSSVVGPVVVTATYAEKTAEINLTIVARTVEKVVDDIGGALGRALTNKGSYYGITLNFSQDGVDYSNTQAEESVLYPVVATLVNYYMPEYLTIVGAKYFTAEEDFWEDGSGDTAYYAMLSVDEVGIDIISYCYSGYLLGQIAVYSIAE